MIYFQIFILNSLLCIVTLWIVFQLCVYRLLKQLSSKRIDNILKNLLPADKIRDKLMPITEDLRNTLPEIVPGYIKFFGKSWYNKVKELVEALGDKEKLEELIALVMEEINLPEIVRKKLLSANPGVVQLFVTRIQPWIIGTGIILGMLTGFLQLIF